MSLMQYAMGANYKRHFDKLKEIARQEKRCYPVLVLDTVWCVLRYGLTMTDYRNFKIYNRTAAQRREYVGAGGEDRLYGIVSPAQYKKRYTIKPDFMRDFAKYTKREIVQPGKESFADFCAFVERNPVFMSKPYDGLGGAQVKKERVENIEDLQAYYDDAEKNRIFFEALVKQHPQMNLLCESSVNTMRMMTLNDRGTPRLLWAGLRVGNGVNAVDNFHAEGMAVKIDLDTGKLMGKAINKENEQFDAHPVTGVVFDGFQIPCFKEAKEMVLQAALESDKIRMVGWDVAISEDGPVVIEGNRRPGFDIVQVLDGRGRMDIARTAIASVQGDKK